MSFRPVGVSSAQATSSIQTRIPIAGQPGAMPYARTSSEPQHHYPIPQMTTGTGTARALPGAMTYAGNHYTVPEMRTGTGTERALSPEECARLVRNVISI